MDCGQSQLLNIPDGFIHVTLKASKVLTCADYIIHYGFWFDMKGQTWRFLISAGEVSTSQWASNRPRFACLLWRKNDDRVQRLLAKIIDSGQNLNGLSWGKHCKCFLMGTFRTCVLEMKMGTNDIVWIELEPHPWDLECVCVNFDMPTFLNIIGTLSYGEFRTWFDDYWTYDLMNEIGPIRVWFLFWVHSKPMSL